MAGDGILSIEMALSAATLVLGLRLAAFLRAEKALGKREARARAAFDAGDARQVEIALRRLGAAVPLGDWTRELRWALQQPEGSPRLEALQHARQQGVRKAVQRAARGQALDLVALSVACGLGVFARAALPAGPWFWGLGALAVLFLIASVILRGTLSHSVRSTLERLTTLFTASSTPAPSETVTGALSGSHVVE